MGTKKSKPAPAQDFAEPWVDVDWTARESMKDCLRTFQLNHPDIQDFRVLIHGPVGAGKSCFINSVCSAFAGRIVNTAEEETSTGQSCTIKYKGYKITDMNSATLPFILFDIMGLENKEDDEIQSEDIISALKGHIKDGYTFNPRSRLSPEEPYYIKEPSLSDRIHCLVSVMSADAISRMDNNMIQKMNRVRKEAVSLGIPHVVLMTKIDLLCPLVKSDLTQVYRSRKVKNKMQECSNLLGPPVKCVFPVRNYNDERDTNSNQDVLILMAMKSIASFVKDRLQGKCCVI